MSSIKSIAVIGLGYVGLPLTLLAASKKYKVFGIDIDPRKIKSLSEKKSYIDDVSDEQLAATSAVFTDDIKKVSQADAVIVCVPTPVTEDKMPDLGPVKGAVSAIAPHLKPGTLVVIESTINPGVCDEIVLPLLEEKTGMKVGKDIYLAHCPERINPGDPKWNVSNINRVIGANSQAELDIAVDLYENLIDAKIKPMGSLKEAEAVKIVENSFRDINIAFVNELAMSFHKLGINLENVIDGAATKPFSFMPHRPGAGVGGHCIPVDPYYLIEYAHGYGFEHDLLRGARTVNESMPQFTVDILSEGLNEHRLSLKGTAVTLLGLSYKPNVGDDRESPANVIKKILDEAEVDLTTYDPFILGNSTVQTLDEAMAGAEAIVLVTGHDEFKDIDPAFLKKNKTKVFIDGRNLFRHKKDEFAKNGITYIGIGI
ncbi:MAG TPA: nucleotide sugar dehydrogenase [Candidatus Saccharibacteria bacterium]|nr:nucleotide sugar dehydrogenase [Candidatus Saccharibacteria bacterium]HRQ97728.1 nucleotide sugar dehydrogenase [Candidatus Saccharibacteria bacterium]